MGVLPSEQIAAARRTKIGLCAKAGSETLANSIILAHANETSQVRFIRMTSLISIVLRVYVDNPDTHPQLLAFVIPHQRSGGEIDCAAVDKVTTWSFKQ